MDAAIQVAKELKDEVLDSRLAVVIGIESIKGTLPVA